MTGAEKGRGIHWIREPGKTSITYPCGALRDQNRPDGREDAELVLCPDCRWAWLVASVRAHHDMLRQHRDTIDRLVAVLFPEVKR